MAFPKGRAIFFCIYLKQGQILKQQTLKQHYKCLVKFKIGHRCSVPMSANSKPKVSMRWATWALLPPVMVCILVTNFASKKVSPLTACGLANSLPRKVVVVLRCSFLSSSMTWKRSWIRCSSSARVGSTTRMARYILSGPSSVTANAWSPSWSSRVESTSRTKPSPRWFPASTAMLRSMFRKLTRRVIRCTTLTARSSRFVLRNLVNSPSCRILSCKDGTTN